LTYTYLLVQHYKRRPRRGYNLTDELTIDSLETATSPTEPSGTNSYSEENHITIPVHLFTSETCVQSRYCAAPDDPRTIERTPVTIDPPLPADIS
jgi:hypothetical protein